MKNNSYYYFPIILSAILVLACKKNISPENTSNNNVIKQSSNSNDVRKIIPIENIGPKVTSDWDNNQKLLKAILDSANSSSAVREGDLTVLVGELCASGFTQQTLDWININIGAGNARNNMIASAINMSDESIPILFASIEKMAYNDEKSSAYDAITMKLSRMRLEELNILVKNTNKSTKYSDIMGSALATKIDRMGFNNHDGDEFQVAFGLITDLLNIQSKPGQAVLKGYVDRAYGESFNLLWSVYESNASTVSEENKNLILKKSSGIQPEVTLSWISKQADSSANNQHIRNSIHHLLLRNTTEAMNVILKNPYNFSATELDNARYQIMFYASQNNEYNAVNELAKSLTSPEVIEEVRKLINKTK